MDDLKQIVSQYLAFGSSDGNWAERKKLRSKMQAVIQQDVSPCVVCGLPQTSNPHPKAGTPEMLNIIGAMIGCLPCANKRANGRASVISALRRWLETEAAVTDATTIEIGAVLDKLNQLEETRRKAYHDQSAMLQGQEQSK